MLSKGFYKIIAASLMLAVLAGCPVTQPQTGLPHDWLHFYDQDFNNRDYYIYLPSSYRKTPLPLVITCHGTNPWDTAHAQINEWKWLAEKHNFVVIAPVINSARGFIPPSAPEGTQILQDDEKFILKIVNGFLDNPNIDRRAIMITGWSAGGFATYYVGLRHPEIFRAVVARQCNFVREYYPAEIWRFNPYQPVLVFYGEADLPLLKADSQVAYRFLKDAGQLNVTFRGVPGGHARHPELAVDYFFEAINKYPQPRILSATTYRDHSHRVRLDSQIVGPVDAEDVFWDFGDGDSAPGKVVEHVYRRPGKYQLAVMRSYENKIIRFTGQIEINKTVVIKTGGRK